MISACSARLLSFSSGLRLQLLISTRFNTDECLTWGKSLEALSKTNPVIPDFKPILNRLLTEPGFALNDLRHNAIASGIIGYTSAVEYYLQDIIRLCLQRNSGLRKKGLSGIQISALELEQHDETKTIKRKLISSLSSENSKGALFTNKLKKASSFLSLPITLIDGNVIKSLDSVWSLRNQFAHVNQSSIELYKIVTSKGELILPRKAKSDDYTNFILELVRIIDESNNYLFLFDQKALEIWGADKFE